MTTWLEALLNGIDGDPGINGTNGVGLEVTPTIGVPCAAGTSGTVDFEVYAVPSTPTGPARFVFTGAVLRLTTALVGAGTVTLSIGTTAGGTDLLQATAIVAATAAGTLFGLDLSTLGSLCISTDGYNAKLAAGAKVYARLASTGVITTAPVLSAHVYGMAIS